MKRTHKMLASAILLAMALPACADRFDCFPLCDTTPDPEVSPPARIDLCRHGAVRDLARIDRELQPVKDVVGIATNPTGFVLKQVNDRVVHIPAWIGYALDPKGAIRAKVMERVRHEAKKAIGIDRGCVEEAGESFETESAPEAVAEDA